MAIRGAWFAVLAGGIGGVTSILYTLYYRGLKRGSFDSYFVISNLVQPIIGVVLGSMGYFLLVVVFLILNISDANAETATVLGIILGWLLGLFQQFGLTYLGKALRARSSSN